MWYETHVLYLKKMRLSKDKEREKKKRECRKAENDTLIIIQ